MPELQLTTLLDKLGGCTSAICMVHCLSIPLLLLFGMDTLLRLINQEWVEWVIIAAGLLIGLDSFSGGYFKHKQHYVPVLFLAGFLLIINGETVASEAMAIILPVSGAGVVIYAHLQNLVLKQRVKQNTTHLAG